MDLRVFVYRAVKAIDNLPQREHDGTIFRKQRLVPH